MKRQYSFAYARDIYRENGFEKIRQLRESMKREVFTLLAPDEKVQEVNWYGHNVNGLRVITLEVISGKDKV